MKAADIWSQSPIAPLDSDSYTMKSQTAQKTGDKETESNRRRTSINAQASKWADRFMKG